jgi:hypothetical protein
MAKYQFPYHDRDNRTISVEAESGSIAKDAADLLLRTIKGRTQDQERINRLAKEAAHYAELAQGITRPSDGLKRHYLEKAQGALDEAKQIIADDKAKRTEVAKQDASPTFGNLVKAAELDLQADKTNDHEVARFYRDKARAIREGN